MNVQIKISRILNHGREKAVLNIILDKVFVISGVRLYVGEHGYRLRFPVIQGKYTSFEAAHPLDTDTRKQLTNAAMEEFQRVEAL